MSETIGKLSSLEYRVGNSDNYYWLNEQGKQVSESEVLDSFGQKSDKQEVEAIWKNKESDIPVKITGLIGRLEDETYYIAEGSQTGIPGSQIEWVDKKAEVVPEPTDSPEVAALKQRVQELEQEKQQSEQQMSQLEQRLAELEAKVEGKQPPAPKTPEEESKNPPELSPKPLQEWKAGDPFSVVHESEDGISTAEDKYKFHSFNEESGQVIGTHTEDTGPSRIIRTISIPADRFNEMQVEAAKIKGEIPPEGTSPPADDTEMYPAEPLIKGGRVKRASGWLGYHLSGGSALTKLQTMETGKDGGRVLVTKETVEEEGYVESDRRAGRNVILGAVALVATGVACYLLGKQTGHNPHGDIDSLRQQLTDVNSHLSAVEAKMTAEHAHGHQHELNALHQLHLENVHAHKHDLQAIHGIHNQIARDHIQELRVINGVQDQLSSGGYSGSASSISEHINSQVDLNSWTWNVAHHYQPGKETDLINSALKQYGNGAHLVKVHGVSQIALGNGRIVNSEQMRQINTIVAHIGTR